MSSLFCEHKIPRYSCKVCSTVENAQFKKLTDIEKIASSERLQTFKNTGETCEKCGSANVTVTQFQNRAADEGTSVKIYCKDCKHTNLDK